jgi:hypothetical protein
MNKRMGVLLIVAGLALAACGTDPGDRAGSGALTGAATSPNQVYLGPPAWEQ